MNFRRRHRKSIRLFDEWLYLARVARLSSKEESLVLGLGRITVYFLVDTFHADRAVVGRIQHGFEVLIEGFHEEPRLYRNLRCCVITFGGRAREILPLGKFPPTGDWIKGIEISDYSGSGFAEAVKILCGRVDQGNDNTNETGHHEFPPWVVIFSSAVQTSLYGNHPQINEIKKRFYRAFISVVSIGEKPAQDLQLDWAETHFHFYEVTDNAFEEYFRSSFWSYLHLTKYVEMATDDFDCNCRQDCECPKFSTGEVRWVVD